VKVTDSSVLLAEIQKHQIGEEVTLTIVRGNDIKKFKIKLEAASKYQNNPKTEEQ